MPRKWLFVLAAIVVSGVVLSAPASAAPGSKSEPASTSDLAAQRRAGVYVTPGRRNLGPNSVRQCRAWLAQEYRVSGTVVVPRMQCWWE